MDVSQQKTKALTSLGKHMEFSAIQHSPANQSNQDIRPDGAIRNINGSGRINEVAKEMLLREHTHQERGAQSQLQNTSRSLK